MSLRGRVVVWLKINVWKSKVFMVKKDQLGSCVRMWVRSGQCEAGSVKDGLRARKGDYFCL